MSKTGSRDLDKQSVLSTSLKVMVVDNKKEFLAHVGEFLSSHLFEVTCVDKAGTALNMLTDEKTDFDILLLDSDLTDVEMIPVLRLTKDMNILKIVMKDEADDAFLLEALDNGAFLVVKKKLTNDTVIHVRQHVIRERIHKSGQFKLSSESETKEVESASPSEMDISAARKRVRTCHAEENPDVHLLDNENVSAKKSVSAMKSVSARKRSCVEWTKELHSKFVSVVRELGDGNCFPKTILDAMGVPGLTRMQVASHLQSLRKQGIASSSNSKTLSSNHSQDLVDLRMCGRMPLAAVYVNNPEETLMTSADVTLSRNGGQMDMFFMNNEFLGDSSVMNEFGTNNIDQINSLPSTELGSGHHTFPAGHTYDDFFHIPNGMEGEETCSDIGLYRS